MQDVRVIVYEGKHHPVDSKEVAFVAAGKRAFLDAIAKARPQVLEPIVDLDVNAPEQHMGDISGGLASKRARISGTDSRSEEHTSELQSLMRISYAVFCLKKKKKRYSTHERTKLYN